MGLFVRSVTVSFIWISVIFTSFAWGDICERCIKIEECHLFSNLTSFEQEMWVQQLSCNGRKVNDQWDDADYVCCPLFNIWGVSYDNGVVSSENNQNNLKEILPINNKNAKRSNNHQPDNLKIHSFHKKAPGLNQALNEKEQNEALDPVNYDHVINEDVYKTVQNRKIRQYFARNIFDRINRINRFNIFGNQQSNNKGSYGNQQGGIPDQNYYGNQENWPNAQNFFGNQQNRPTGQNVYGYPQNGFNNQGAYGQNPNNNQYQGADGRGFNNQVQPKPIENAQTQNPSNIYQIPNQHQNPQSNNGSYNSIQCEVLKTLIPDPQTGCCGQDDSDAERITDLQTLYDKAAQSKYLPLQAPPPRKRLLGKLLRHRDRRETKIVLRDRIIGGKETELDQFPWTAYLKITFNYGSREATFSCGGSLISRQYVLTAGHCIYEEEAKKVDIKVTLAEYDKRTFPRDCKDVMGEKPKCIENVRVNVERVILHPQYDDKRLHNDIALLRLEGYAPYTQYIRPICLPPMDIDNDDFADLPLAVVGWGRNGPHVSDIKKSTVVKLVPQRKCHESYPYLGKSHLCAGGRIGEDTCKGDSGGPLMMLYRERFYLIGVVSGKRMDSPCGSTIPSLFTNVYKYLDWIKMNMKD